VGSEINYKVLNGDSKKKIKSARGDLFGFFLKESVEIKNKGYP